MCFLTPSDYNVATSDDQNAEHAPSKMLVVLAWKLRSAVRADALLLPPAAVCAMISSLDLEAPKMW